MRLVRISLMCALLCGCGGSDAGPEEALRHWVAAAQAAAENRDRGTLIDMVSERYADARGNDRKSVDQMLRLYFLRQQNVLLVSRIDSVEVSGETAGTVSVTVGMSGADSGVLGFSADAYRFDLELEQEGDDWMLIGARWAELGREPR